MSLSTLPDLCLLTIFGRIPLYDLLATVNRVCHRWASLCSIASHRRHHSLILVKDQKQFEYMFCSNIETSYYNLLHDTTLDDGTPYYGTRVDCQFEYCTLMIHHWSERACKQLATLLPNITSLQIGPNFSSWEIWIQDIIFLLEKWSTNLINLNLSIWCLHGAENPYKYDSKLVCSLIDHINLLSSLKRLKLEIEVFSYICPKQKVSSKLEILSQLDQFEYSEAGDFFNEWISESIKNAFKVPNYTLKQISLKYPDCDNLIESSPDLKSHLKSFSCTLTPATMINLNDAMSDLNSLQKLSIYIYNFANLSYTQLINSLSHLSQLILLDLKFYPDSSFADVDFKSIPMSSVKALNLTFSLPSLSHRQLEHFSLSHTFPNVQVVRMEHFSNQCTDCALELTTAIGPDSESESFYNRIHICTLLMLKPLKNCTKLSKIYSFRDVRLSQNPIKHIFTPD